MKEFGIEVCEVVSMSTDIRPYGRASLAWDSMGNDGDMGWNYGPIGR